MASDRPRLLFVVTEDWYFHSHRLALAEAALDAGFCVAVATRVDAHRRAIEACGCEVIPLQRLRRRSLNPLREIAAVAPAAGADLCRAPVAQAGERAGAGDDYAG